MGKKNYQKMIDDINKKKSRNWKPSDGKNLIRILPPIDEEEEWFEHFDNHFIPGGGDGGRDTGTRCLGEDCYVCDAVKRLEDGDDDDQKIAQRSLPRTTYVFNIVDLNNDDEGAQIWRTTSTNVIQQLLEYAMDADYGEFWSQKKGRNVVVNVEKKGNFPNYKITLKPKETSIDKGFLEGRKDLSKFIPKEDVKENKRLARFLAGTISDDEELDDARRRAKKVKKKGTGKKKSRRTRLNVER